MESLVKGACPAIDTNEKNPKKAQKNLKNYIVCVKKGMELYRQQIMLERSLQMMASTVAAINGTTGTATLTLPKGFSASITTAILQSKSNPSVKSATAVAVTAP